MGLLDPLRPKWKNSDPDVRRKAAAELDDPATLVEIAAKDSEWFVRHEALAKLRDIKPEQRWYCELVKTSIDEEIRRKTVKQMLDEDALAWVAKNDKYQYVRDAAEHRLDELRRNLWGEKPVSASS